MGLTAVLLFAMKYDTVVVGAGVSGLTAAILLAQDGRKVALLEKSHNIAPTIRGLFRGDVYFDTGFHYAGMLGPDESLTRLCRRLGILSHIKIMADQQTGDYFYCTNPEYKFKFKVTLEAFMNQLIECFPNERDAIVRFTQIIRQFLDKLKNDLFGIVMEPMVLHKESQLSLHKYLQDNFTSPVLKTLLSIHCLLYGSMPQETSLFYHSIVIGPYYDQCYKIINGGYAITHAYEEEMLKYDIDIYTRSNVNSINIDDDRAVKSLNIEGGEFIECDNCIFTSHPRALANLLPEGCLRPVYKNRLHNLTDTLSAFVLYGRSEKANLSGNCRNMIIAQRLYEGMYDWQNGFSDSPMFISQSLSDSGIGGVSVICPCSFEEVRRWENSKTGKRSPEYYQWKAERAGIITNKLKQYCNETLGDFKVIDEATPLTFRDYMNAPGGCLYGTKHSIEDMPLTTHTKIKGLYLSGQATVSAGFMGAMLSGFLSAAAVTKEDYRRTMQ